jgi:polysaccharide transporter, PST family
MSIAKKVQNLIFNNSGGFYKILANIGWLFADRVLRMGCGLIIGAWVARYLGVQQYGILNYAMAFVAILNPFAILGLEAVVVRRAISTPIQQRQVLGTAFWMRFVAGCLTCLMTTIGVYYLTDDRTTIAVVTILGATNIFQAFDVIDLWYQSQVLSKYTVIAKNTVFVAISILRVYLLTIKAPLVAFAWAGLADIAFCGLALVISYQLTGHSLWQWQWCISIAKSLIRESLPLVFSSFAIMIYMRIDQIMLGQMLDNVAVGIYSSATRISEIWYFIPVTIVASVSPSIYQAREVSQSLAELKIMKLNRILVLVAVAIAIPMTFLSKTIIVLMFGDSYTDAGNVLAVHTWAMVFVSMGLASSSWFIAEGLTRLQMYKSVLGALVNIILNLFLIPPYGAMGAAIATVISYAASDLLSNVIHPQTRSIFKLQVKSLNPFNLSL